jgi:hypothetical protein
MAKLVTIAEFDQVNEAHVIKGRLEAEGIRCYLTNENLNTILPSFGFTRVKLQVSENDGIKAFDIFYEEPLS